MAKWDDAGNASVPKISATNRELVCERCRLKNVIHKSQI